MDCCFSIEEKSILEGNRTYKNNLFIFELSSFARITILIIIYAGCLLSVCLLKFYDMTLGLILIIKLKLEVCNV